MIYERDIKRRLVILRLLFLLLAIICILAFIYQYQNLGYLIIVVFLFLSFLVVNGFSVRFNYFAITNYYFFGLIKRRYKFNKGGELKISSFDPEFGANGDTPAYSDADMWLGCLFSIFSVFVPPKIQRRKFRIKGLSERNDTINTVDIILTRKEHDYLIPFIN